MTIEERLVQDLESAISLREMFYTREIDRQFVNDGNLLFFAVDSTLLHRYFGKEDEQKKGASGFDIFRGPEGVAAVKTARPAAWKGGPTKTIGAVVTHYIMHSLGLDSEGRSPPLLLLPGHAAEASKLYDTLVAEFYEQQDRGRNAKANLRKYLEETEKAPNDEVRRQVIDSWEQEIYRILYAITGPHERFRAFNALLARQHLMQLERAAQDPRYSSLRTAPNGRHVFNDYDWTAQRGLDLGPTKFWDEQIVKEPSERSANEDDDVIFIREHYWKKDREALLALDRVNRLLQPHGARVVLFTSNGEIMRAGTKYFPFKEKPSSKLDSYSFSDLYLRDPKCLLSEAAIVEPSGSLAPGSGKLEWLDTFLGAMPESDHSDLLSFRRWAEGFRPVMRRQAAQLVAKSRDLHEELHRNWRNYVDQLLEAHSSASQIAIAGIRDIVGLKDEKEDSTGKALAYLKKFVADLTEDSWNDFFLTATKSGFDLVGQFGDVLRRALPPLLVLGIEGAEELIEWISEPNGRIRNQDKIRARLAQMDSQVSRIKAADGGSREKLGDQVGYVRTLIYALLFASVDRWSVSKLMTQRARLIARRIYVQGNPQKLGGESFGLVTGREACYFGSVAHRLTAKTAADLAGCTELLSEAKELENTERKWLSERPEQEGPIPLGLRIEAEERDIDIARLLFDIFANGEPPGEWRESINIFKARSIMNALTKLLTKVGNCDVERVVAAVKISVRSDYFMMAFIIEYCGGALEPDELTLIRSLLIEQGRDVNEWCLDPNSDDTLAMPVIDTYICVYAGSCAGPMQNLAYTAIESCYRGLVVRQQREKDSRSGMPYDRVLLENIRSLIERHADTY